MLLAALVSASAARGDELPGRIDALLARLPKKAAVGLVIIDLDGDKTLYERAAQKPLRPASNMKLLTLAAAALELGPKHRHETRLAAGGALTGDRLAGPLIAIGGGDPNLSRRFSAGESADVPALQRWAAELFKGGLRVIEGDIIADDRFFEGPRFHPDWDPREAHKWYAAEVTALSLNDNCVDIEIRPGPGGGSVTLIPPTQYLDLVNELRPAPSAKKHAWGVMRAAGSNRVVLRGRIWRGAKVARGEVAVDDPSLFFVTALKESLGRAGIRVVGQPRRLKPGEDPKAASVLIRETNPLNLSLSLCGKRSLNHYAESILKTLGRVKGKGGDTEAGLEVLRRRLVSLGVPQAGLVLRDGSGLSRKNRLTAGALAALLIAMERGPRKKLFRDSLAVGGVDGTLRRRFRRLPEGVKVEAKTGTLRDTSALSGYLTLPGRRAPIVFAMLMNDVPGARSLQEKILALLYS